MPGKSTRELIVEAADDLFYRQGFDHTSFSDIADAVKISRGNFYYYFKTKDDILDDVIESRLANARKMLDGWEREGDGPSARIRSFINILVVNRANIKRYGCPVGTLTSELAKLDHPAQGEASKLFTLFRTWLKRQFVALGRTRDADALAMHVLGRSQGIAALASAFQDERFLRHEVEQLHAWLDANLTETSA
jgi:TetR/AcrR family transcriptional regulator, transcriptional repressor for nem operon